MANIKELTTRIALKYDSYSNWTQAPGKDLVLLKGEIGICEIPSVNKDSTVAPTVIFKVGTGAKYPEDHAKAGQYVTFEDLPWASARSADVYSWAKASKVELVDKKLIFTGGNPDGTDKEISFNYVTLEEVKGITDDLALRLSALEAIFDGTEGGDLDKGIIASVVEVQGRLDVIEGESDGSIKKAMADALASAQTYIDKKLGSEYSETNTIYAAITDAKSAGTIAQGQVKTLAETVEDNKINISDIANLAIPELESRIEKVEAFFGSETDREDGSYEHLNKALDTLVEIQTYLTGEGEAAGNLIDRVAQNEASIKVLQETLAEGGDFEQRVANNEFAISDVEDRLDTVEGNITSIQEILAGTDSNTKLREDIIDLQSIVKTGADSNTALRKDLSDLQALVNNKDTGLAKVKEIADNAASLASDNTLRIAAIEEDYLREADSYLFSCGTASTVTYTN